MPQYLVIVESPAKAKTINKYLGRNYKVLASNGHLRDLPKSQLGVDVENNFEPRYITIRGKGSLLSSLKTSAKNADIVYLATDPDREGEAISWHLSAALGLDNKKAKRVTFNEITKTAVIAAIKAPREIDQDLVDAQQARRVLDRIIGYRISPILWKKIKKGLSAGRVQSVASRLIVDRDREIEAFIPQEYWNIYADLLKGKESFTATFHGLVSGDKMELPNEETVNEILVALKNAKYLVSSVKNGQRERKAAPPFTTSSFQQDASNKLNFTSKRSMSIAQRLYEGVAVPGHGTVGLITYMRTDSLRISDEAKSAAQDFIRASYGSEFLPKTPNVFKTKKSSQDAHEAIRPTHVELTPASLKDVLEPAMHKVYKLIWERFIASNMSNAVYDTISAEITANSYKFKASGSALKFAGFLKVYADKIKKEDETMPQLQEGELLNLSALTPKQSFTQPPPHFTEASLIKLMEENGIGRPSTYAPTISTILARGYCTRDGKSLLATELGGIVVDLMKDHFPNIVDETFTAAMETQLDSVEDGEVKWKDILSTFYPPFQENLERAEVEIEKIQLKDEESDVVCDKCGRMMVYKLSKFGKFLACPGFPECRNTKTIVVESGVNCPDCKGKILVKKTKRGKIYYGCENNPTCPLMLWEEPVEEKCPVCGKIMVKLKGRGKENVVCSDKECKSRKNESKKNDSDKKKTTTSRKK